ncbi:phosphoserine phosphatase SerB [Flaviflexus massiliensis]|uniref:phosphoserine phosphatase SerB n=1 Tax=Flaviflexus massiliensis TaxID=1522309 RepID=UPI0009E98EB8|nr:phosphoserine phosphatase SerB [Flaviflexus massiliensis]
MTNPNGGDRVRLGLVSPRPLPGAYLRHAHSYLDSRVRDLTATEVPVDGFAATTFTGTATGDFAGWNEELVSPATALGIDAALTWGDLAEHGPALIVTDVDSTFIQDEAIELLARRANKEDEVKAVTDRAMRGELSFEESLTLRVAVLEGLPSTIIDHVAREIRPTPGAERLVELAHDRGARFGLVSGGFTKILDPLAERLSIDQWIANELEINDGVLTGRTIGPVIGRETKAEKVTSWADKYRVPLDRTVCVGDGANDLDMLGISGLGIAFQAKPIVREQADANISFNRLDAVGALFGWA